MVSLRNVGDYTLDRASLELAAEVYLGFRETGEWEERYKWEILTELNDWYQGNELTGESVTEFIGLMQELSPEEGPLVNWRDIDELTTFASEDPDHLAELLRALYEGDEPLKDRIEQFREAVNVGTPAIGYLMAAHDMSSYTPYKDGTFQKFLEYFSGGSKPNPSGLSVHEKYARYLIYCQSLRDFLNAEGYIESPSMLDAQDFMYTIIEYDGARNDFIIQFLLDFADSLQEFKEEPLSTIEELRSLPSDFIRDRIEYYDGREKVARVRHQVLERILAEDSVDYQEIKDAEESRHEKNIYQAWTDYKILIQPYLDFFKSRFDLYLDDLSIYLVEKFGADELDYHIVNFQGASNFPGTRSWMALHPSDKGFRDSYQLFLAFDSDHLEVALHSGKDLGDERIESRVIEDEDQASISLIEEEFQAHKSEFDRLNGQEMISEDEIIELDAFTQFARQIEQAKQMVFYGPPGTGKTFAATNFAKWWIDQENGDIDQQIRFVTFHPSYAYEDFIEGLSAELDGGELVYMIKPGVFKEFARHARNDWDENGENAGRYVLIIDEINRGNLPKIFGETITLLEKDKRVDSSSEIEVQLAHSGKPFGVPPNLYVVGTMNTADRSIALVDAALRRRFRFQEFPPDYELLFEEYGLESETVAKDLASQDDRKGLQALSVLALKEINSRIIESESLNKGKQIGHSYLMKSGTGEMGQNEIKDAWKHEILPLLDEYFFGQFSRLSGSLLQEASDDLLNENTQQIRDFELEGLRAGLRAIVGIESE